VFCVNATAITLLPIINTFIQLDFIKFRINTVSKKKQKTR